MAFFECEFPRQIGFTSTGGAGFSTNINEAFSGFEQRNQNWAQSRGVWQIVLSRRPQAEIALVSNFFMNVAGRADAFRFFWPLDFSATAQSIGAGDGVTQDFQLIKTYTTASRTYTRNIKKPIMSDVEDYAGNFLTDTVQLFVANVPQVLNSDYTVDSATGIVSFTTPPGTASPLVTPDITATFQFHYPVRFDCDDQSNVQIEESDIQSGSGLATWSQINLMEIRL